METSNKELVGEIDEWLDNVKEDLIKNVELTIKKNSSERETLEIMKTLIFTMKAVPKEY